MGRASGAKLATQLMSAQVWQGSAPIDMVLPLTILTRRDVITDVIERLKSLIKLSVPREMGGLLYSPGPKVSLGAGGGVGFGAITQQISVIIGRTLYFPSVVVTAVNPVFDVKPDRATGKFQKANTSFAFRTFLTPTQQDIDTIFEGKSPV